MLQLLHHNHNEILWIQIREEECSDQSYACEILGFEVWTIS